MDFILYVIVLLCVGLFKMKAPSDKVVSTLLNNPGESIVETAVLPIGNNFSLIREADAYTLILTELGLK